MQPERWAQIQDVFNAAVEMAPRDRAAYVEQACRSDADLRQEVESLLRSHEDPKDFLDHPTWDDSGNKVSATLQPGDLVHHYQIVSFLGAGGMGEVYLALDTRLHRKVALKILPRNPDFMRERLRRFEQEARAASALSHPNVCVIYEISESEAGDPYIAMEHVDGVTLRERMLKGALPIVEALEIAVQVASALSAAHKVGVIHRDIKPENVMIRADGSAKVLDFGIAKLLLPQPKQPPVTGASEPSLLRTIPGMVIGTPRYMAPEQARGLAVDGRTDLWSLVVVLREMLTGSAPFGGSSQSDVIAAILVAEPPTLSKMLPRTVPRLEMVDRRLLAKDPEARYQSADELIRDLRGVQSELTALTPWREALNLGSLHKLLVLAALLIVLATVGGILYYRGSRSAGNSVSSKRLVEDEQRRIVALLPFENISHEAAQEYFSEGMTEEIRGQLSKLASLQLISRAAVARYKDPISNLRQIASELNVGSVVTGSVRRNAGRVRVNVALVDTRNDRTIWSEQYDRDLKDIFAVQSDVAIRIAKTLGAALSQSEQDRIEKTPTANLDAYQLYLQSQDLTLNVSKENLKAIQMLQEAFAMDSRFALALARMSYRQVFQGFLDDPHFIDLGIESAHRALAIDPNLAEAHFSLATAYSMKGQASKARLSFLKSLELQPNFVEAMSNYSLAEIESGRIDEGLYWAARAFRLAPNSGNSYYHLCTALVWLGDDAVTEHWLAEGEEHHPSDVRVQITSAHFDFLRGKRTEGLQRARTAAEMEVGNEEPQNLLAELTMLEGTADAEARSQRMNRVAPESIGAILAETNRLRYAYLLLRKGDAQTATPMIDQAEKYARKAMEDGDESFPPRLELAAIDSLRGDTQEALHWLDLAYATGARDHRALAMDPLFEKLRADSNFKEIIHRMENDVTRMRQRAKEQLPEIFAASNKRTADNLSGIKPLQRALNRHGITVAKLGFNHRTRQAVATVVFPPLPNKERRGE